MTWVIVALAEDCIGEAHGNEYVEDYFFKEENALSAIKQGGQGRTLIHYHFWTHANQEKHSESTTSLLICRLQVNL